MCGIIGDPVGHSMSPFMHNAAFAHLAVDFVYVPFRVGADCLGDAIAGIRALGLRGCNVTVPHKEAVIPLLDEVAPLGRTIGAVNTITNDGGVLVGDNTDAPGFLRALEQRNVDPSGKKVLILGAGGAARAIAVALAERRSELTICNRTLPRARRLAEFVSSLLSTPVRVVAFGSEEMAQELRHANVVVNATSLGMAPLNTETPVPGGLLRPDMVVVDIVYNPPRTRLLREAEARGARAIGGVDMLVWQGALAFKTWTGLEAPVTVMRQAVVRRLGAE